MTTQTVEAVWLVDIGYVVKAGADRFKLDYLRAERWLRAKYGRVQTYLFNGVEASYGIPAGLQAFYDAMTRHGMVVRLHPMASDRSGVNRQKRVDVDLCAHLIWHASEPQVKALIVTTGDQDFVPAFELARGKFAKRVVLFTYEVSVHADLVAGADEWWTFETNRSAVERRG